MAVKQEKHGRLTVIRKIDAIRVFCRCDCGAEKAIRYYDIRSGRTTSCGCKKREVTIARNHKHGMATRKHRLPEYEVWCGMIARCENPNHVGYPYYGARGIGVCPRWRNSFSDFLSDVGRRPNARMSLERIDNDRGYEPGNVRWATWTEQMRNTRGNHLVECDGEMMPLTAAAEKSGITASALKCRIKSGMSDHEATTTPPASKMTLEANGVTRTISEWSSITGISTGVLYQRLYAGWSHDRIVNEPIRKTCRSRNSG